MTLELKQKYETDGYVVIPNLISSEEQEEQLREASERAIDLARAKAWPYRRTVGSQFPPYDNSQEDIWGVQHVMHPDLAEPSFLAWYTSKPVLDLSAQLMDCNVSDLQIELFNILINPIEHGFALRWHRDDVKATATEEEERQALAVRHYGIQWNTALYDDECLFVVPRSHSIPRTSEQRAHSSTMDPPRDPLFMPGSVQVKLKAGETVVYNQNILHCATYAPDVKRVTLHACIGNACGGTARARNILQHGVEWMKDDAFRKACNGSTTALHMLENTLQMGSEEFLGYSQE